MKSGGAPNCAPTTAMCGVALSRYRVEVIAESLVWQELVGALRGRPSVVRGPRPSSTPAATSSRTRHARTASPVGPPHARTFPMTDVDEAHADLHCASKSGSRRVTGCSRTRQWSRRRMASPGRDCSADQRSARRGTSRTRCNVGHPRATPSGRRSRPRRRTLPGIGSGVAASAPRIGAKPTVAASSTRGARRGTRLSVGRTRAPPGACPGRFASRRRGRPGCELHVQGPSSLRRATTRRRAMRRPDPSRGAGRRRGRPRSAGRVQHDRSDAGPRARTRRCSRYS